MVDKFDVAELDRFKKNFKPKIIRWKGDSRVYSKIIHYLDLVKKNKSNIHYNVPRALKSTFGFCFNSSTPIHSEYTDEKFIDILEKHGSFCSHLVFFIIKFAIGSIASNGMIKDCHGIEQPFKKALNISPSRCWPTNLLSLPKKYPDFWEQIHEGGRTKRTKSAAKRTFRKSAAKLTRKHF